MKTLAQRLKLALDRLELSQREAGKICGVSQQSINYIISKDLEHSKLAPTLASALNINPNWLIYGQGTFKENPFYELPILNSAYEILKHLHGDLSDDSIITTVCDTTLGKDAFAYMIEPHKIAICANIDSSYPALDYLYIKDLKVEIISSVPEMSPSFKIVEYRERNEQFTFGS